MEPPQNEKRLLSKDLVGQREKSQAKRKYLLTTDQAKGLKLDYIRNSKLNKILIQLEHWQKDMNSHFTDKHIKMG